MVTAVAFRGARVIDLFREWGRAHGDEPRDRALPSGSGTSVLLAVGSRDGTVESRALVVLLGVPDRRRTCLSRRCCVIVCVVLVPSA